MIEKADLILASIKEIKVLAEAEDVDSTCSKMLNIGVDIIAVKIGSLGLTTHTESEKKHIPPFKVDEIDPTGPETPMIQLS